ncbi:TDP-N-acetylfucosamine:lipid II N-acetylfucosaminyltransferase [Metabacillus fastidiosus]|uniref:TDP-N-acetylfucosamine:lipid II N-acetylfucosaminyltransferase n=1 Tax=Metabacillus fastidiosus TaxID=1458 RepID=UPI002E243935|nr:TDP-N-acetylfucosamine:lipid II N-acetylfucosaminyltransferase [Metabacillus fastidiosus]MED4454446.1 TDP-N-acetylfucosamine:lipid II N-acetylfucosaminyltransferase [Metabacillus fastidiosus]
MDKKLSICMIVKDEEKNLRRCLDSLRLLLEKDYIELIIVDTGSTDNTVDISREYTEKVYFHEWNGNFSDMRNKSISYATGEWIFIIDADEELETPNELISLLESNELSKFNSVRIREKNLLSLKSNKYVYHVQERLFRNDGTFQYRGTIHNQPIYKHPVLISDNIWLMHYGYINEDTELMEKKFKRTANMLKKELEKDPENVYYRFQLARSYMMHKDSSIALEEITKAYESMKTQAKELIVHRYYIFGEYARMSLHANKFEQVIEVCKEGLSHSEHYLDLYYYMGHAYFSSEEYVKGLECLEKYVEYYQKYNNSELDLSSLTAVEMYTLDENAFEGTLSRIVSTIYRDQSLAQNVSKYQSWLNQIQNKALESKLLTQLFIMRRDFNGLLDLYKEINDKQRLSFINYLETLKKDLIDQEKEQIEHLFSTIEGDYGLLNRIRITTENRSKLLLEFINNYNIIEFHDEVIIEFVTYLIESNYLIRFFKKLSSLTIKKIVQVLIEKEEKKEYFLDSLRNDYKFNDFQNNRIYIAVANVLLLTTIEEQKNRIDYLSKLSDIFLDYIKKGIDYIQYIYNMRHVRLFYNTLENNEERFLILMAMAYEHSSKEDYKSFAKYFKEATGLYPYFSKISYLLMVDVYYQKAALHEKGGEYLHAVETYESLLLLPINYEESEEIENKIMVIEKKYKELLVQDIGCSNKYHNSLSGSFNLHLVIDSPYTEKIVRFVNQHFSYQKHSFILVTENKEYLQYVRPGDFENLYILSSNKDKEKINQLLGNSSKIFIHYLHDEYCKIIANNEIKGEIHWVLWGGDLYNYINFELYDETTKKLMQLNSNNSLYSKNVYRRKAIRKVDYVLTWIKQDYELLTNHYITAAKFKLFSYPQTFNETIELYQKGEKSDAIRHKENYLFMVGNSGDPSNNHLEVLSALSKYKDESFSVVLPLSYGFQEYIEYVISKGYEMFGNRFIPIREFMSEANYIKLLDQVDVAFMNHNRQQATGNILLLLGLNKKIYMKNSSAVFQTLVDEKYTIYDIQDLEYMKFEQLIDISSDSMDNEKKVIQDFSDSNVIKWMGNLFA